ncbi:MAG: sensor histidine kinase [Pseudonocardiaceae bacterium]
MDGPTEYEYRRHSQYITALIRSGVVAMASMLTLLIAERERLPITLGVVVLVVTWSGVYLWCVLRVPRWWLVPADLAMVAVVCLTQKWTVPAGSLYDSTSWVLAITSITVVILQWHTKATIGAACTVAVVVLYLFGVALAAPESWTQGLGLGLWTFVEAALSRGLYVLVMRGGRLTDQSRAREEETRRAATVATTRRAEEREYLATLHDTAATTLLMVGIGVVGGREPWLARQAAQDLMVLTRGRGQADGSVELAQALHERAPAGGLQVEWKVGSGLTLPVRVAEAISRGVREALINVGKHAGVETATVRAFHRGRRMVVEVVDQGVGFDSRVVSPHRRGISHSIMDRMAQVGGQVFVISRPGQGTRVRWEWLDE